VVLLPIHFNALATQHKMLCSESGLMACHSYGHMVGNLEGKKCRCRVRVGNYSVILGEYGVLKQLHLSLVDDEADEDHDFRQFFLAIILFFH